MVWSLFLESDGSQSHQICFWLVSTKALIPIRTGCADSKSIVSLSSAQSELILSRHPFPYKCAVGCTKVVPLATSVLKGTTANSHHYAADFVSKNIKSQIQLNVRHIQEVNSNHNIIVSIHQFDAWTCLCYNPMCMTLYVIRVVL
jgi:hypothetical protein